MPVLKIGWHLMTTLALVISYALTFAGVTLRLYLPASQIAGVPFADACQVVSWMCWVPNLVIAGWLVLRRVTVAAVAGREA